MTNSTVIGSPGFRSPAGWRSNAVDTFRKSLSINRLLKLARDLPYLANAQAKPVSVVVAEARARLRQIESAAGQDQQPFNRITAEELATGKFEMTDLIDGVLVKDQLAGLVAPKKSLKTSISVDLAGHRRIAEAPR